MCDTRAVCPLSAGTAVAPPPPTRRYPYIRRYPDIRRSKSLGAIGEWHSQPGMNKAASPTGRSRCSGTPTYAFLGDPTAVTCSDTLCCCTLFRAENTALCLSMFEPLYRVPEKASINNDHKDAYDGLYDRGIPYFFAKKQLLNDGAP